MTTVRIPFSYEGGYSWYNVQATKACKTCGHKPVDDYQDEICNSGIEEWLDLPKGTDKITLVVSDKKEKEAWAGILTEDYLQIFSSDGAHSGELGLDYEHYKGLKNGHVWVWVEI